MIAHNKKYQDTVINLDGSTFVGCTFERCRLIFSGLIPFHFEGNKITECQWEFAGPAKNTISFMTAIYAQGGDAAKMIEKTFENIRENAAGQRPAGDPVSLN